MQRNYFTVLFFLKKSKLLKNGEAPICMRITINGKRAEVQIKRSIDVTMENPQRCDPVRQTGLTLPAILPLPTYAKIRITPVKLMV